MLVDNKFIYISLPRCASTSFLISVYRQNISVQHGYEGFDIHNSGINKSLPNEELADNLVHAHEPLNTLEEKFGYNKYDIISVNRDRHERFISLWKHVIDEIHRVGDMYSYEIMKNINENDFFFFTSDDVARIDNSAYNNQNLINKFIKKFNLDNDNSALHSTLLALLRPYSNYHNFDKRIKWFDFEKLYELENWVSNKLEKTFKLEKINSSKHFECNLTLTDNFISKYNNVYDRFDFHKNQKTII